MTRILLMVWPWATTSASKLTKFSRLSRCVLLFIQKLIIMRLPQCSMFILYYYLGSCISANGSIAEEISARITRAQAVFLNLHHLWRRRDISLTTKVRVYNATVRPTLLYGCETWALRSEDEHRLQVFNHRCLRSIGHFSWKQRLSNKDVRHRIFGVQKQSRSLDQIVLGTRMRWLGHVLRMKNSRLPKKFLLSKPEIGWRRSRGG